MPRLCFLCEQNHQEKHALCALCLRQLLPLGLRCHQCAHPLSEASNAFCGQCISDPPHFRRTLCHYVFCDPLRQLIHQFKYHQGLFLATLFGELMVHAWHHPSNALAKLPKDSICLLPVPLHPQRLKERGFNQAAYLTKYLAKQLDLAYDLSLCRKIKNTPHQALLAQHERRINFQGVFTVVGKPEYEHLIIVDDVITTGSTANELARLLKKTGATEISLWCCARAILG